jgi:hypothetical protein
MENKEITSSAYWTDGLSQRKAGRRGANWRNSSQKQLIYQLHSCQLWEKNICKILLEGTLRMKRHLRTRLLFFE